MDSHRVCTECVVHSPDSRDVSGELMFHSRASDGSDRGYTGASNAGKASWRSHSTDGIGSSSSARGHGGNGNHNSSGKLTSSNALDVRARHSEVFLLLQQDDDE